MSYDVSLTVGQNIVHESNYTSNVWAVLHKAMNNECGLPFLHGMIA